MKVKATKPKNGTIKHSDELTPADIAAHNATLAACGFKPDREFADGHYVWFGMLKGPFESAADAKSAYAEWDWESKHS